jgi:hypothetical protein
MLQAWRIVITQKEMRRLSHGARFLSSQFSLPEANENPRIVRRHTHARRQTKTQLFYPEDKVIL